MKDLLNNVPPWAQRVITVLLGLLIAVVGVKVAGLEELKKLGTGLIVSVIGVGLMTWAAPHTADAKPAVAPAPPDEPKV